MTKILYLLISIIAMGGSLLLAFQNVDLQIMWSSLGNVSVFLVLGASLMALLSMGLRAYRWQLLLAPLRAIPFPRLLSYTLIGFMANNILPAHAGELIKALFLGKKENLKTWTVITTVLLERLFDSLALVALMIGVIHLIPTPQWLSTGAHLIGVLELILISLLAMLALNVRRWRTRANSRLSGLSGKWSKGIGKSLLLVLAGLAGINSLKTLAKLFAVSLATWIHMAATVYLILSGLTTAAEGNLFFASVVVIVILAFAIVIPSTPGYVGVTQLAFVIALSIFKTPETQAISSSVIFTLTQYIPITAAGLIALVKEGFSFTQLRAGRVQTRVLLNDS